MESKVSALVTSNFFNFEYDLHGHKRFTALALLFKWILNFEYMAARGVKGQYFFELPLIFLQIPLLSILPIPKPFVCAFKVQLDFVG